MKLFKTELHSSSFGGGTTLEIAHRQSFYASEIEFKATQACMNHGLEPVGIWTFGVAPGWVKLNIYCRHDELLAQELKRDFDKFLLELSTQGN